MSSLSKLVRERDNRMNSARQLDVTVRPPETKHICVQCRRVPNAETYRARWLAAHPLPRRYCHPMCGGRITFTNRDAHKRWHLENYIKANMPPISQASVCADCGGALVSVTW